MRCWELSCYKRSDGGGRRAGRLRKWSWRGLAFAWWSLFYWDCLTWCFRRSKGTGSCAGTPFLLLACTSKTIDTTMANCQHHQLPPTNSVSPSAPSLTFYLPPQAAIDCSAWFSEPHAPNVSSHFECYWLMRSFERIRGDQWRHQWMRAEVYRPYQCDGGRVGKRGRLFKVVFCVSGCRWLPNWIV